MQTGVNAKFICYHKTKDMKKCIVCKSPDGEIVHGPAGGTDHWHCFSCGNKTAVAELDLRASNDQLLEEIERFVKSGSASSISEIPIYEPLFVPDGPVQRHYDTAIQPIDYITANNLDFLHGNVIKYVSRWHGKDGVRDLDKAIDYLNRIKKLALDGYYGEEYKK